MVGFIDTLKNITLTQYALKSFLSYYSRSFRPIGVHAEIKKEWGILKGPKESLIPDMVETTEKPILDLIKNLSVTGICIDVGGWIGYYSILLARKASKVIVLEPDIRNQQYLDYNIKKNNIQNIMVLPYALDVKDGKGRLAIAPNTTGNSLQRQEHPVGFTLEVTTRKLSTLMKEIGESQIDLIKMDIEGVEFPIIKNLGDDVFDRVDNWIIECHIKDPNEQNNLQKIFEKHGYKVKWFRDNNEGRTDHIYSYKD